MKPRRLLVGVLLILLGVEAAGLDSSGDGDQLSGGALSVLGLILGVVGVFLWSARSA